MTERKNHELIDKCPDPWPWINNCLEKWLWRVFRLYRWCFRSNSLARKRRTTQYNTAELIQARQNITETMHRDTARENVVNITELVSELLLWAQSATKDYIWAEHKLHPISRSFILHVMFFEPIYISRALYTGTCIQVTYSILRAYTGTGVSHSQHRKKSGEVLD